jgi:hypothetical protein
MTQKHTTDMKQYNKPTITVLTIKASTIMAGSVPAEITDPKIEGSRQMFAPSLEPNLGLESLQPSEPNILGL